MMELKDAVSARIIQGLGINFDDETKKITTRLYLKRGKKDGAWKLLKVERAMEKWAPPA